MDTNSSGAHFAAAAALIALGKKEVGLPVVRAAFTDKNPLNWEGTARALQGLGLADEPLLLEALTLLRYTWMGCGRWGRQ
jgi:hypothetical protein